MKRSTILTIVGVIGVIGTAVASAKAGPKAAKLLDEARFDKGEELTVLEKVKMVAPIYIPTAIIGASTIGCIVGANLLNARSQASLASAYALLDSSYKEYKKKVNDIYGEDADVQVTEAMAKEHYEDLDDVILPEGKRLFFDYTTCRYFEASFEDVLQKITMDDGLECYILTPPYEDSINDYIY